MVFNLQESHRTYYRIFPIHDHDANMVGDIDMTWTLYCRVLNVPFPSTYILCFKAAITPQIHRYFTLCIVINSVLVGVKG